jgi:hypothetical protein
MANAKYIEKMAREHSLERQGLNKPKEESMRKRLHKVVQKTKEEPTVRVRLSDKKVGTDKKKPWIGLTPGTKAWKELWASFTKNPDAQNEMIRYQTATLGRDDMNKLEELKKKRERDQREIEKYVEKHGVQKRRGRGPEEEEDDDDDYDDTPKRKEKPMKRSVVKKTTKKSHKKEVMRTVNKPFGAEGRTFDNYAIELPDDVKSIKQLKQWLRDEKRTIIEFKDDELRAYAPERVTASGRVAKVTVKKQGARQIVTYRSNKNSRIAD